MKKKLVDIISRGKRQYIRSLQVEGKIATYELGGYLAFDTEDLDRYKNRVKIGRPRLNSGNFGKMTFGTFLECGQDRPLTEEDGVLLEMVRSKIDELLREE